MNVSQDKYVTPTVSDPEPSDLDRRTAAIWIGVVMLIALLAAVHFGPDVWQFLKAML